MLLDLYKDEAKRAEMEWGGLAVQQAHWRQELHSKPSNKRKAVTKMIRAKMQVATVTLNGYAEVVKLFAVYSGEKNAEDNTYAKATPSATLEMQIDNPNAHGKLKPGDKVYVDLTPAN